jgi:hypothetical protein
VVGSALFGSPNYAQTVGLLRHLAEASSPIALRIDSSEVRG